MDYWQGLLRCLLISDTPYSPVRQSENLPIPVCVFHPTLGDSMNPPTPSWLSRTIDDGRIISISLKMPVIFVAFHERGCYSRHCQIVTCDGDGAINEHVKVVCSSNSRVGHTHVTGECVFIAIPKILHLSRGTVRIVEGENPLRVLTKVERQTKI